MQKTANGGFFFHALFYARHCCKLPAQTMRIMRLLTLFLFISCLSAAASGTGQSVTISGKNLTIETIFAAIEKQTGYVVGYDPALFSGNKGFSLNVKDLPLSDFLGRIIEGLPLEYDVQDKTIFISSKLKPPTIYDNPELAIISTISGMVISHEGEPLSGATIAVKGEKKSTLTNSAGRFSIEANIGDILSISFVGYEKQEVKVTDSTVLVKLKISVSTLDETQITAYGKTTRRFATGSIGSIKGEDIARQPVMNVLQALPGLVPGLVLSSRTGNAAAPVKVEIRGRNTLNPDALSDPLYVVDGLPLSTLQINRNYKGGINGGANVGSVQAGTTNTRGENPLMYLNPRDIERIDVLKDADATAIYGARGTNGVILITTKRSKAGPTRFDLSVARGSISIPKKLDLMNTEEYLEVRREAFRNDGIIPDEFNAPDLTRWDQSKYTDWQEYFYKPGKQVSINASVYGGVAQSNYRIAANYHAQNELNNNGGTNEQASISGNFSHVSIDNKFKFDFSSRLSITNVEAIPEGNYILTPPNAPNIYNERGEFNFEPYRGISTSEFPFSRLMHFSESKTTTAGTNILLSYEPLKGLIISTNGAYTVSGNDNANYSPSAASDPQFGSMSSAFFGKSNTTNWSVEPQIAYNRFIGKGSLSVQVGGSMQYQRAEGMQVFAALFPDDNLIKSPNNAAMSMLTEGFGEYKYNAAFGIINYRWDNKYVINVNARRDGSSKFGPGKRFGNFGSVGIAWIASEEEWVKTTLPQWISFVKLTGSFGNTGSDAIGDYEYLSRWGTMVELNSPDKILSYNGTPAIQTLAPLNHDFRWESTHKLNASMSVGLFEDNVNVEVSYYANKTGNQLTTIGTPFYTGFAGVRSNWDAVVQNTGFEFMLSAKVLNTKKWHLSGSFNVGVNRNKLVDFPQLEYSPYANRYTVGKSLNLVYLYHYIGIHPMTGDYVIEDHNKDGVVFSGNGAIPHLPEDDRYIVYDLNPKFSGGFNFNVSYNGFGLSGGFLFSKRFALDPYKTMQIGNRSNRYIPKDVATNHWQKAGDIAIYPKYTTQGFYSQFSPLSDGAYTDISFLKFSNLAFSYDLPLVLISKLKLKGCRFSINTQNLFAISNYRGLDPEILDLGNGTPVPRVVSSSLTFTF